LIDKIIEEVLQLQQEIRSPTPADSDHSSDASSETSSPCKSKASLAPIKSSPSPPPTPPPQPANSKAKKKRKSTTVVEKHLREMDMIKTRALSTQAQLVNAVECLSGDEDEAFADEDSNKITLRVFTRMGLQRVKVKRNEEFRVVYERVAELEKTSVGNLVLMHGERRVEQEDTAESLNVLFTDFIDCHHVKEKVEKRIEVVENGCEEVTPRNMVAVILQTVQGRKSRVKFNVAKVMLDGCLL
jgi:hypothetical protein